jgi:hypothetical protein
MRCGCWRSRLWGVMLFVYVPPSFVVLEALRIDFDSVVGGRFFVVPREAKVILARGYQLYLLVPSL